MAAYPENPPSSFQSPGPHTISGDHNSKVASPFADQQQREHSLASQATSSSGRLTPSQSLAHFPIAGSSSMLDPFSTNDLNTVYQTSSGDDLFQHNQQFAHTTSDVHQTFTFPQTLNSNQFPTFDPSSESIDTSFLSDQSLVDPTSTNTLNPNTLSLDTNSAMDTLQHNRMTPPHMLRPGIRGSQSSSPHQSLYPGQPRSRNTSESLDPSSAAFPMVYGSQEWAAGPAFNMHRRAASDCSEISSHSAQASPYLGNLENFDTASQAHISPLLPSQSDAALFGDSMNQFSLNDHNQIMSHISPAASPHLSPNLGAQQQLPHFTSANNFGLTIDFNSMQQNMNQPIGADGMDQFSSLNTQTMSAFTQYGTSYPEGQADTMSPPEINIDFVPTQTNPFEQAQKLNPLDTLLPPEGRKILLSQ